MFYWEIREACQRSKQKSKPEFSEKIIIILTIFVTQSILNFWEDSAYVSGFK